MAVATDSHATLMTAQEVTDPNDTGAYQMMTGTGYAMGKVVGIYSSIASATAGAANDTISFCKLKEGTIILAGWLYTEDGLSATDGALGDLGVVYEASDGTDDADALLDGIDIYDGAIGAMADALPAGVVFPIPNDMAAAPYVVTGGVGTVQLINLQDALVASKDVKLVLFVIIPGV
jgi:hypothetical protein